MQSSNQSGGVAPNSISLNTDTNVAYYAVGYDVAGNYLGEQNCDWWLGGGFGRIIGASNGVSSIVIDPTNSAATGIVYLTNQVIATREEVNNLSVDVGVINYLRIQKSAPLHLL